MKYIIILSLLFIGCKTKQPDIEYIISGRDTISVTCFGGYTVDLSKAKNAHSYRNKTKDSSFTEFEFVPKNSLDSISIGIDTIIFTDTFYNYTHKNNE